MSGAVALPADSVGPRRLARDLARVRREMGITAPESLVARGMLAWAALFGCVSFELFGQYGPDAFAEPKDIFEHHLQVLVGTVGLG